MSGWFGQHLPYALAWLSFAAGHSVMAHGSVREALKRRLGAGFRLTYNLVATLHIALVWLFGLWLFRDVPDFALPPFARAALIVVQILGLCLFVLALRDYDLGRLSGLQQLRERQAGIAEPADDEPLHTVGLHRLVRHPLYSAGLIILLGQAIGPWQAATAIWGSLYLIIGARFEERRLMRILGSDYADYRARVPAFIPWKGIAI